MSARLVLSGVMLCAVLAAADAARAACGCMLPPALRRPRDPGAAVVAKPELIMDNTRVALVRDGDRTVMTMANDVRETDIKSFALIVPVPEVPTKATVRVADPALFQDLDAATRVRFVEQHDPEPCPADPLPDAPATVTASADGAVATGGRPRPADYGVKVEAHFDVGEYTIAVLSAQESRGLIEWLRLFKYDVPRSAADVIDSYVKQGLYFFVARVSLDGRKERRFLRPLQVEYRTPRFMLPIRMGMVNADGPQELLVFAMSRVGRIEPVNYRMMNIPTGAELPGAFAHERYDIAREIFLHASAQNADKGVVFLEAAGPARQEDNPGAPELPLARFGASWSTVDDTGRIAAPTFTTRMHFRYERATFPEDLVLQETKDESSFRQSFTLRFEAQRAHLCDAGLPYLEALPARRATQAATLAQLTGRALDDVRARLGPLPGSHLLPGGAGVASVPAPNIMAPASPYAEDTTSCGSCASTPATAFGPILLAWACAVWRRRVRS